MDNAKRMTYLKIALFITGLIFVVGLPLMMYLCRSAWMWQPHQYEYEQMILGIYATLGIFLIIASKNPLQHQSLIWFTIISSVVHGVIMLLQALYDATEHAHLYGDVPGLLLIALILAILMPRSRSNS